MIYLLTISITIFIFFLTVVLLTILQRDKLAVEKRLVDLGLVQEEIKPVKVKKKRSGAPVSLTLERQLSNAGIKMRANEYLIAWAICSVVIPGIMAFAGIHPVTILVSAVIGLTLPPIIVHKRKSKRLVLFEKQLGDALVLIGNCLRAGMTFHQAMANVANEMPDPIAKEFSRTVKEIQLGSATDDALERLAERVKSKDLLITVSAVQIQREVGGNLLDIIETISQTIKDRAKIRDDIRVMSAQGRSSGIIIGMLPLAIGGILALVNPDYVMTFFDTKAGTIMLIVAGCMEVTGFFIINRIVNIKY